MVVEGYDGDMIAGEERNFSCYTDLEVSSLAWVNKKDNSILPSTRVGNRIDLSIRVLTSEYNGAKIACRAVTSCGTSDKTISMNVTSEPLACVFETSIMYDINKAKYITSKYFVSQSKLHNCYYGYAFSQSNREA